MTDQERFLNEIEILGRVRSTGINTVEKMHSEIVFGPTITHTQVR